MPPRVLDPKTLTPRIGSGYPSPFDEAVADREKRVLGDPLGLNNFGVNLVRIPAGGESTQRHWHSRQDEFVMVLEGELTLVTDDGEHAMGPGMVAGFPAGVANGHKLVNRTDRDALYIEIGDRTPDDEVDYPDIDMLVRWIDGVSYFVRKDGTPYKRTS